MPHQRVGFGLGLRMRNAQAATQQQAFAIDPIGFGQHVGDTFGHLQGTFGGCSGVDQQGEFVAPQTGDLITGIELVFQARHDLQDQSITGLMTQ